MRLPTRPEDAVMKLDFTDKIVAVSGAAIGFGQAIGRRFADAGARVFGCDILASSPDLHPAVAPTQVDLRDRAAAAAWIRLVESAAGRAIDVLVCNAGGVAGQTPRPLEEISDADWDQLVAVNLGAA